MPALHRVDFTTVLKLFSYLLLATCVLTLAIVSVDALLYGAILANERARSQLRKKRVVVAGTGAGASASNVSDATTHSSRVDREYSQWLAQWTSANVDYVRALDDQARSCFGQIDRTPDEPSGQPSDDVLEQTADNLPSFVRCAAWKSVGIGD